MTMCARCVLPDTFPGIHFSSEGVCNYCNGSELQRARQGDDREKYRNKFEQLLKQYRTEPRAAFDVIAAYSGGKDSTYTLKLLTRTYGLRVLAVTFDHGFMSPKAMENIHTVTDSLGVHLLVMSPSRAVLGTAFRRSATENLYPLKTLVRASAICNTCMHLVKSFVMKLAVQMEIPFIAYGWSPGQAPIQSSVMRLNTGMIRKMQESVVETLQKIMGNELAPFILSSRDYTMLSSGSSSRSSFLYTVHPLAYIDYSEEKILEEIKTTGWTAPRDTDANSTNCLLNVFANQLHLEKHGFHPYAHEIAGLVREGHMTREAGIAKLSVPPDTRVLEAVINKLGLPAVRQPS